MFSWLDINTWHSQSRVSVSKCQSGTLLCTWRLCQYISPSPLAAWRSPWPHPQPGQLGDRHGAWWSKRPSHERRHWRKPPTKQGQRKDFFGKLLKKSQKDIKREREMEKTLEQIGNKVHSTFWSPVFPAGIGIEWHHAESQNEMWQAPTRASSELCPASKTLHKLGMSHHPSGHTRFTMVSFLVSCVV